KHCNRLEQVLARAEWTDPGIAEALMYSSSGALISGTMSNVFLVRDERLSTPRLDRCGVAGVMRRVVLAEAAKAGIAAEERALGASGGYFWLQREYSTSGPATAGSLIQVEPGASLRGVLARLEATGTVRHARAVELYLRLRGLRPRVQAGNYEIPPHASPEEIIALFEQGKVVLEQLTVVEGATFDDFLAALDQHPHVLHTLRGKSPAAI